MTDASRNFLRSRASISSDGSGRGPEIRVTLTPSFGARVWASDAPRSGPVGSPDNRCFGIGSRLSMIATRFSIRDFPGVSKRNGATFNIRIDVFCDDTPQHQQHKGSENGTPISYTAMSAHHRSVQQ